MIFISMNLENQIRTFISEVPHGCIFDAHAVIFYLLENHPDEYLRFHAVEEPVNSFHSRISRAVDKFTDNGTIERVIAESYSKTITGNYLANACWKKQ